MGVATTYNVPRWFDTDAPGCGYFVAVYPTFAMKPTLRYLAGPTLLALLALTACETRAPRPEGAAVPETKPTVEAAEQAELAGEFVLAAREYDLLSRQARSPQREHFSLKVVDALIRAGQVREARERLRGISVETFDIALQARKRIHEAQLSTLEGRPDEALRLLTQVDKMPSLPPAISAEALRHRAQTELALERPVSAIKSLLAREKMIAAKDEVIKNQQELWNILTTLSRTQLELELKVARDPALAGWLALAMAALENAGSRTALANAISLWRQTHLTHLASDDFLKTLSRPRPGQIGRIERISLLLPLTSEDGQAAAAVRDGFLAMHNADRNPDKPQVQVVDSGANPAQAVSAWQQAVIDGAHLIVGPLGLEAVDQVAKKTTLEVPTILLSHATEEINTSQRAVFQFGLTPDQEATQVAERAWLDGHRQAAVLYPATTRGRRMQAAFVSTWQRLGGLVVSEQEYLADQAEYADPVKRLLNVVQSETRKERLEAVIKLKVKLEARAREDIDFLFLAADARHARLIKPQLSYHRATRVPVYATSLVFTGRGDPGLDADLDGIQFGDMPWMLVGDGKVAMLRKQLQVNWPYAHSPLDRLYALGVDAYAMIPHLNRLSSENTARLGGVTSGLSLGRGGRLQRQLLWAQFRKGVPALIDTSFRHKGQFDLDTGVVTRPGG